MSSGSIRSADARKYGLYLTKWVASHRSPFFIFQS